MYKKKVLSEEHKKKMSEITKRRWAEGAFDSPTIRESWRQNALSNIAKVGKVSEKRYEPSQEMIDDMSAMGDADLSEKWEVSRYLIIRLRKRLGIKSFTAQHGTIEHKVIGGVENKYCQHCTLWLPITNFGKNVTRRDGLRGWCKGCESENRKTKYVENDGAAKMRGWLKTEAGGKSRSATMRKVYAKRRDNYIKFERSDMEHVYSLCNNSCAYCETEARFVELEFDHFIPIKLGGKTEPSNMLPACPNCNRGRGGKFDREPREWILWRFGEKNGQEIYDRCVNILENLLRDSNNDVL
jgi:5-methylcytosine-specific restriction endonuclease McrA